MDLFDQLFSSLLCGGDFFFDLKEELLSFMFLILGVVIPSVIFSGALLECVTFPNFCENLNHRCRMRGGEG